MEITHYGHSSILITDSNDESTVRLLIDPGTFSRPEIAGLTGLDAIVVTHQHPDHVDPELFSRLADANRDAQLLLEPQTAEALSADAATCALSDRFEAIGAGWSQEIGPLRMLAVGGAHAVIHPSIPAVGNVAVIFEAADGTVVAHTGDSLVPHPELIGADLLAFPLVAPWSKMQETIDFLRVTHPTVAVPIHDAVASAEGRAIYMKQSTEHAPEQTAVIDWPENHVVTVGS